MASWKDSIVCCSIINHDFIHYLIGYVYSEWKPCTQVNHNVNSIELNSWNSRFFVQQCHKSLITTIYCLFSFIFTLLACLDCHIIMLSLIPKLKRMHWFTNLLRLIQMMKIDSINVIYSINQNFITTLLLFMVCLSTGKLRLLVDVWRS